MSLGVEIAQLESVPDALAQGRVAVLRGMDLHVEDQVAFTADLGTLIGDDEGLPQVRYEDDRTARADHTFYNEKWHADVSWSVEGPAITVLYGLEVGPAVASTAIVDTVSAFARLTESERYSVRSWRACHHVARSRAERYVPPAEPRGLGLDRQAPSPVWRPARAREGVRQPTYVPEPGAVRPVVVTHPGTGREGMTLGDHAWTVVGRSDAEGLRLVDRLQQRLVELGDHYVHEWHEGDLLVFDNRTMLHRREPGARRASRRVLRRTVAWPDLASG